MHDIRMCAVSGSCSGTKSGILSTRYLPMDHAGWSCVVADCDGVHFVLFTLLGNDVPKKSKLAMENIGNERAVCG